jgi:UDP-N-acetylglucosamine 2-epimerase (non-hydrolysing)
VLVVCGTRPEAIKVAPVIRALQADPRFEAITVATAQHREMLDQVLDLFGIVPDHDLNIIRQRQTLTEVTVRALGGLSMVVEQEQPAMVLVQGDTTSTLAGAMAGFYFNTPVVHLEAGLRTGDVASPFPEEANRRLTTQLAALHLAPTWTARSALLRENVDPAKVVVTGNTVIDALQWVVRERIPFTDPALGKIEADPRRKVLVTAHRRESWGEGMRGIGRALADIARIDPDVLIVFPIHRNPVVREAILPQVQGLENVRILEPAGYGDFARLMSCATLLLTDSGGIQEEGPSLGIPVLVMRDTTERPEAIAAGTAALVGTEPGEIVAAARRLLTDPEAHAEMARAVNPFGDGRAAERTLAAIAHHLGIGEPADELAEVAA